MPPVSRITVDMTTGHSSFPPTIISSGSTNVFVNSIGVARKSDPIVPHGSPSPSPPHPGNISKGSSTVFVNSLDCGRVGDAISCGQFMANGSGNVSAGG